MISVKIPLMTKIGEPDVNGRVITKEAFQKCIESDFYREMILNGQLRLVYGGTAGEFLDKEHYCIDPIKMHDYIFGHISQITEENVMVHIYRHEEIFLRQLDNGFKVYLTCIGKLDHTTENIDAVRDENAQNTCDIIANANMNTRDLLESNNAQTQRILDYLTNQEIQNLRTDLQAAQLQLSNLSQTASIVDQLRPFPTPAYITCSPYASALGINGCNSGLV